MKKIITIVLSLTSMGAFGGDIKPTAEEEKALFIGMRGMMERLGDPAWIQLASEKGDGCWLDKNTLVEVDSEAIFNDVPSRCVSWDIGIPNQKAYTFMPTRIIEECDKANLPYNTCVD